ncbi:MAG: HAMP domain-containing histidine kinase [Clostridia bacterium]|nr:HAMP domain-containing histidine kinase [Clostridia bacterium]
MFKNERLKSIILYNVFFIMASVGFYFLIPLMLNYPPNSINNAFEQSIDMGLKYDWQYIGIILFAIIVSNIYFINRIKVVDKYKLFIGKEDEASKNELEKIKKKCFSFPYQIYLVHAVFPSIAISLVMWLTGADGILTSRIVMLIFAFTLVLGLLAYIFSKGIFNEVLTILENRKKYKSKKKVSFKEKIFLLFLPLLFVAVLFSTITADTLLSKERGDFIFENYNNQIVAQNFKKSESLEELINNVHQIEKRNKEDVYFVMSENEYVYSDVEDKGLDEFFRKYTFNVAKNGHTYGYYASGIQGAYIMVYLDGVEYAAGIMYRTDSVETFFFLVYTVCTLMLMCIFFLEYFARDIANQVSSVSKNMNMIANEQTIDYDQKMPVLSNDELGDLVISFNKILDLEKKHAKDMEKNQEIIVEQERLSSLGQLIGGIAHNLKTPIMSISGASQAVRDLIKEYDASIGNSQVTLEDHHDIAKEMNEWNDKIKVYLEYMTEIINAAKGQAVSMNASTVKDFTLEELVARVQILMKEQLMHRACSLNLQTDVDKKTCINGELSAIVQVLNNLIINAIDAYKNKPGEINLKLSEDDEKVYIVVEDFAGGIPESVQQKLFKQMITTKGKDGTGLGLYMCYSTIKGKFNGEMSFKTEEGKGTQFLIALNKKK